MNNGHENAFEMPSVPDNAAVVPRKPSEKMLIAAITAAGVTATTAYEIFTAMVAAADVESSDVEPSRAEPESSLRQRVRA